MKKNNNALHVSSKKIFFLSLASAAIFFAGCKKFNEPKALKDFEQVNLVANNSSYSAAHVDPTLLNAWGLAFSSTGTPWVNATGGHVSEVYDKDGALIPARPAVNIPSPGDTIGGLPTGIVFSGSATDFLLANAKPARFIFVGVDGVLSAWNGGNNAQRIKNNSATAAYTGLALAVNGGANYLYAANFRAGKIDVWDKNFAPVSLSFKDNHIPGGYSPFNIQAVGSWLYVMYAKVGTDGHDEKGLGNGYVDIFNTDGSLVKRFIQKGNLNSPWGVTLAPAAFFGDVKDDHNNNNNSGKDNSGSGSGISSGGNDDDNIILVGNFGDGRINAYRENGDLIGQLKSHGHDIVINGLWSLTFPPATATTVDPNRLYFTAGPKNETDGLFGYLLKK